MYVMVGLVWTGPLACLSLFAIKSVDKVHLFHLQVFKVPWFHTSSDKLWGGNKREHNISYLALVGIKERERLDALCFSP